MTKAARKAPVWQQQGGYNSDSLGESDRKLCASRTSKCNKSNARSQSASRHREDQTMANNPCTYCKRHMWRNRHPNLPSAKFFWNKCWKRFCPRYACKAMDIRFKDREELLAELNGYKLSCGETISNKE